MARTEPRGGQIKDGSIQRDDLDASTSGQAVVRKVVQGTGMSLSSTGADAGTGDVTVATQAASGSQVGHVTTGAQTFGGDKSFDGQYASTEHNVGNSGSGTVTIDWSNGNCQKVVMTGNCTFGAPSNGIAGARYLLRLVGDGSALRTPSWNAVFVWSGGAAPTLSGASKTDLIALYCTPGGNYLAAAQANFNTVT